MELFFEILAALANIATVLAFALELIEEYKHRRMRRRDK